MNSIDGLFEQIIHYEKTAQEQKNFLQELRQTVISTREKDKSLKHRYTELVNKLTQKTSEWSDKELVQKWLVGQETIYREQQMRLKQKLDELTAEKGEVLRKLSEEKENFCKVMSQHMEEFGPDNCLNDQREVKYTFHLQALQHESDSLLKDLENVTARQAVVRELFTETENLQKQLEIITSNNKKLTSSLCEEVQTTANLEQEHNSVSDFSKVDKEFTRIQKELGIERQTSVELEQKYSQVQAQIHQLHQKLWLQQLKQQQTGKSQKQQ